MIYLTDILLFAVADVCRYAVRQGAIERFFNVQRLNHFAVQYRKHIAAGTSRNVIRLSLAELVFRQRRFACVEIFFISR